MTTITLTGIKLTYESQNVTAVGTAIAQITVPSKNTTFSYTLDGGEDIPDIDINGPLIQAILDGNLLSDLEANTGFVASLGTATWSGGATTVLALNWPTGPDSDTDLIFVLDGAALPDFATPAQWNAFDDSLTGFGQATGAFAPGANIRWTAFDSANVTEDDEFAGTPGRDTYNGGRGDDYFNSSDGGDTYNGGKDFDQVSFRGDPGGVTANLATGRATDGWGNTDVLKSIEMLRGSMFDDDLAGNGGRNHIRGLAGDDDLNGGGGRDLVRYDRDANYGGNAGVTVNLKTGKATDGFGDSDTLRNFSDVIGSDSSDRITGSGGRNDLQGLDGNDKLFGLNGIDSLHGDGGRDRIDGGGGNDSLSGGAQADLFVFKGKFGDDTLTDFMTGGKAEKIDLSGVKAITGFRDLVNNHLSEDIGGAVISAGLNSITLENVAMAELSANDFLF